MPSSRSILGNEGEALAASFLERSGYRILQRNFRTPLGEIDLVAREGDCLCFVEVKTRQSLKAGSPAESVHFAKRRKLVKLAYWYMKARGLADVRARFDVVGLTREEGGGLRFSLLKNAFDLNDAGY